MIWWLKKQFLNLKLYAAENYQYEAESLIIGYAVCYALGAAFYFGLPWELPTWVVIVYLEAVLLLLYLYRKKDAKFKILSYLAVFTLGLCIAKANALYQKNKLEENIPETMYLAGYVESIDTNYAQRTRITLTDVNNYEKDLKGKFRITTGQNIPWLKPGICVETVAKFPKDMSVNPLRKYDFLRANFYNEINASGYAISGFYEKDCEKTPSAFKQKLEEIRASIAHKIDSSAMPREASVIKALAIGDSRAVSNAQRAEYQTAGLAHILAISGMHMGMIALLTFLLIRLLLLPFGSGNFHRRKPAAVISIILACGYFLISGQSISCIRAFIMIMCVLLAVLINRHPVSLRLWALAVLIVVSIMPEAVVSVGFLMSFSAVLGIVAFYEKNAARLHKWYAATNIYGKIGAYLMGVIITDLIASLMTMPYSLYYFHQISVYTTLGNLLAGPIVAFWIMPALLLFLICFVFGFGTIWLKLLSTGVYILNNIASWVSSLSGAKSGEGIAMMPEWGIILITLGMLWLCIWQERWRYCGIIIIIIGFLSIFTVPNVDFVFDKDGTTFACRTNDGKLSQTPWHKNKFLTLLWTNKLPEKNTDEKDGLECNKDECTCQKRIRFSSGKVIYDGRPVLLDNSGYINLKHGIRYSQKSLPRIWN